MRALLNGLLLSQKFFILALLGAVLVAVPTALFLNESNKSIDVAKLEAQGVAPARALLKVVRLTQQHRGLSSMLINGNEAMRAPSLAKQQEASQAFAAMDGVVKRLENAAITNAWQQAQVEWLALVGKMSQQALSANVNFTEHTILITHLLKLTEIVIDHFGLRLDPEPDSYFLIDAVFVQSPVLSETLGRIRGKGAGMLVEKSATLEERMLLGSLGDKANDHYELLGYSLANAISANPALRDTLSEPAQTNLAAGKKVLQLAQERVIKAAQLNYSAWDYFVEFTAAIDAQLRLNDLGLDALDDILKTRTKTLIAAKYILICVIAVLSLLAIFVGHMIIRSVTVPLRIALDAARSITQGAAEKINAVEAIGDGNLERNLALTQVPNIDKMTVSHDEVGELLRSVVSMSVVQRSLDEAFGKMTASLRRSRATERARDWLKSGQNDLSNLMRGEHETTEMANKVLTFLAERLGAGVGVLYLCDEQNDELCLTASYALVRGRNLGDRCGMGEGLIGQAARERKTICLANVPVEYLPISSALGEAVPRNVMAVPLIHADALVGALEIGAFKLFSDVELEFLERAREGIAIGFGVSRARHRTQALLTQTQQQAEELRVQQEELQQSNEELEERAELLERQRELIRVKNDEVEAASVEIQRKAEGLERANTYKSEFLANMSHELRTPLNSMLILSGLLKENKDRNLNDKQVEYANTINGAGRDLLNLINDILDLSKVEAGKIELHYEEVAPRDICTAMETLFRPIADQEGLAFRTELQPEVPRSLPIDLSRTQQILKNLLSNACKFTEKGETSLRIYLPARMDNPLPVPAVAFSVSDTGIGVPSDKQHLIFDAFKQADGGISRHYGGTGLGLSISLQFARKMGGDLGMRSVEGSGSTFTLYLPLKPESNQVENQTTSANTDNSNFAPVGPSSTQASAPAPSLDESNTIEHMHATTPLSDDRGRLHPEDKSILIVEDDLKFAQILMRFVRENNFGAIVAVDGESAVALANHFRPSAVLLDVMLPKIDGWEVMRRLQNNPETRHIPVHFITCTEDSKKAMDMGALGFVTKPVSAEQLNGLFQAIENSLAKSVKNLLIVEDDVDDAKSLLALFSEREILITMAATGKEAIGFLESDRFDCMVLDLGLSDMSGFDLLAHMQSMDQARRIPVIVHSGRELTREQEKELNRYAESIIIKGAKSPERLLNEVTLFLHLVESKLEPSKQRMVRAALDTESMLDGKKMLIVDDDMRNVFSLTSLFADEGIVVIEAENGKEAQTKLAEHPDVTVVLMDIMMPVMDGYEAMRQIRADPKHRELPIIAMTAKAMQGDHQKCLDAGASDYIAKPIDAEKLLSLLRVWACRQV